MATEVEYALMAGRIYQSTRDKINWLPDLLSFGWTERVDKSQSLPSGFETTYFTKGNEIVISYAGTGSNVDWWANAGGFFGVTTEQLRQAADYYLQVKATNPGAIIHLTGHSLGGGLASLMAVFFDETAVTFDQAPFKNSASVSVATSLKEYLLNERGYSQADLQGLTNFISAAAGGGVPNNNNVVDFSVQGEILSAASGLRIGSLTSWTHGAPDLGSIDLHSHALLTAFLQSDRTAPGPQSLSDVTFKLPDVLRMIFDSSLYKQDMSTDKENFIERLVRHQNGIAGLTASETVVPADAMLTRFTNDLWKLAQDGGLTMADDSYAAVKLVSQTLIAFAMQMYYEDTANATNREKELFTNLATERTGSGGIRFDLADVAANVTDTKGYNRYFHDYVANSFSPSDRDRIYDALPGLRDWYVQAGRSGMEATDIQNRGAFMLGGLGADVLTGGSGNDLVVGNAGHDRLAGGAGTDTLLGGTGFDIYYWNTGDGNDRIEDADARGIINVNGQVLAGGVKKAGHTDWESPDGHLRYEMSGTDLLVKLNGTQILTVNENFQSGQFGIRLIDATDPNWENGYPVVINAESDGFVNNIINYSDTDDLGFGERGNDQLFGNGGNDILRGWSGNDRLYGGEGDDVLDGDWRLIVFNPSAPPFVLGTELYYGDDLVDGGAGNDTVFGSWGDDLLYGGTGNDVLYGDHVLQDRFTFTADDFLDGGEGDDVLYGMDGDDVLWGRDDNDYLWGDDQQVGVLQEGDDVLDGGAGNDQLVGGGGQDTLAGGDGNDLLAGDYANNPTVGFDDILDGGAGIDVLLGGGGNDLLTGGTENDQLFGEVGSDHLYGGAGDDQLQGGEGNDVLAGEGGLDLLAGQDGDDQLFGDDGDDFLDGGDGDDVLIGGAGDDVLQGGAGNDTYVFNLGDGVERIDDAVGINRLVFGAGITSNDVGIGKGSLLIRVGLNGDLIHIENFNPADPMQSTGIESFEFADGTTLTQAQLLERGFELIGTSDGDFFDGADTYQKIYGLGGNDVLTGGSLNNLIYGGTGNDQVAGNAGDDQLFGEAGNDTLNGGTGNDVLIGGVGDDRLRGGAGQDQYLFSPGDGADTIVDTTGEGNRVVFGAGISAESVTLQVVGEGALAIHTGQLGDRIQIIANLAAVDRSAVDIVEFADGSTLSTAQLLAQGITITGTPDGDVLTGTTLVDRITGLGGDDMIKGGPGGDHVFGNEGNDQLFGEDGDDVLDGGSGSDVLSGGGGADTYVFGRGSGQDVVSDSPVEQGGPNSIRLTSGVLPGEVRLQTRRSDDRVNVVLTIEGSSDELTLNGTAAPSLLPISEIRFADGTSWDMGQILNHIEELRVTASAFGSELNGSGFRDELIGAAGNDVLNGLGQADRMVGGDGDDWYWVDHAGDAVVETAGQGTDTVFSYIDYILPDHVENLQLWMTDQPGTDPVRGEGNAAANQLIGNFVNNVLIGEAGDDILSGGFGDDDLFGGAGNDTYFAEGDFNGFDTIYDVALPGEGNRLQFGTTMRPGDVAFIEEGSRLKITNSGAAHGVILADFDPTGVTGSLVTDVVAFSSGVGDVTGGYEIPLLALMTPTLGTANAETLVGTANAEVINAGAGDDTLVGGAGNDVLIGGTGNDTYVFNQGDGFDLIDDQPGVGDVNRVQFGAGITKEMLRVSYSGTFGVGGFSIRIGTSGDGLHFLGVSADDPNAPHATDTFYFADGTHLTFAELFEREVLVQGTGRSDSELSGTFANNRIEGFAGSDSLAGQGGNDILEGGTGNDVLSGGGGEDTYVFNFGDGIDRIEDETELIDDSQGGHLANNRILFGPGISLSDLSFVEVHRTIRRILVGSNGDSLELPNFVDFTPGLRTISFSDGLTVDIYDLRDGEQVTDDQTIQGGPGGGVLIGGSGNDVIRSGGGNTALFGGAGNDTLVGGSGHNWMSGGPGNDFLLGGSGGNTFLLSPGSGRDSIQIPNYLTSVPTSRVQFGGGYSTYNPSLSLGSLVVRYGAVGDEIHIVDFDPNNVFFRPAIQSFEFSDRTLSYDELIALGFDINGTSGNDVLTGTNTTDRMIGLAGDDDLSGGAGADTFTGGQGNDTLRGGAGHDSYLFNVGDGIDTVEDVVAVGEGNRIQFGVGISQSDLTCTQNPVARTLTIHVGSRGTDQLILTNFDPTNINGSLVVETVAFADGSTASLASLLGGPVNQAPTVANPLTDQIVPEDAPFSIQLPSNAFADQDAKDVLTYSASLADGTALPSWLSFNAITRTFSGTPDDAQVGRLDLKVTAADSGNLSVSSVFTLTVQNVNDAPTVASLIPDQQATEGEPFTFAVPVDAFVDPDAGDVLTHHATMADGTALPVWLVFDRNAHTFSGTPGAGSAGTLQIVVVGTDAGALSAMDTFQLTIAEPSAQTLAGTNGDDVLIGGLGRDTLMGLGGNDVLDGRFRADTMIGGAGNDTYVVDNAGDMVTEKANEGVDTVDASISYSLSPNVEYLTLTGSADLNGAGNELNNILRGNQGANTLAGGGGSDVYVVSQGDVVVEQTGQGIDTVISDVSWILGPNVENLTLIGTAAINGTGNSAANALLGNNAANVLDGGGGVDVMAGLDGNDTYLVDNAFDTVAEAAGSGTDTVLSTVTYTVLNNVENLVLTGSAAVNGTGNGLDNVLTGNNANNVLSAMTGNDTLRGGAGNDTVNGGSGSDTYLLGRSEGQDLLQDSGGSADKVLYDSGINPIDLVISRQANNLRLSIHGTTDVVTIQNWYTSTNNQVENIQAGNGQQLLNTYVNQLLQAMASFTQQNGYVSWDQAIDQNPQGVQAVLAANGWQ